MYKRLLWRIFSKITTSLWDSKLKAPNSEEVELIKELRKDFSSFGLRDHEDSLIVEKKWTDHVERLKERVLTRDPREFLRWDVIRDTMSVQNAKYVTAELNHLKTTHDWNNVWKKAIRECEAGHPIPFPLCPRSSGNLIHQAYHLCALREVTGIRLDEVDAVFEFGGGYGCICGLLHNLGFKGKYLIYDLPPLCFLQKFFLRLSGIPVCTGDSFHGKERGVLSVSNIEHLKTIIDNNFDTTRSLFIGTWSLSESPVALRILILPVVLRFRFVLIAFQDYFGHTNNIEFFSAWLKDQDGTMQWHQQEIDHLPGNRYLIGSRNDN